MRNICYVFALGIVLGVVTSCKDQPKKDVIITKMPPKQVVSKEIGKVGDYSQARKIEWVGATYTIEVNRTADVSADPVDDGSGNRYYPNRILVRIYRPDGSEFFKREFTKGDFESHLDASYKKHTVLLGVVFDHADDDYIYLEGSERIPKEKLSLSGTSGELVCQTRGCAHNTEDCPYVRYGNGKLICGNHEL